MSGRSVVYARAAAGGRTRGKGRELTKLTGERPLQGVTPDSLLALHDAGYREVRARLGPGLVLDVGCGAGFETVRLASDDRRVVGVDYSPEALAEAAPRFRQNRVDVAVGDASALPLQSGAFDWVCSSHLIEHFVQPELHVAELARVVARSGTVFVVTPNAPADFENPFHVHLFEPGALKHLLDRYFADVWVGGLDATEVVKADFAARRARAAKLLRLDVLGLRHRIPRSWYVAAYSRLLPLSYRLLARGDGGGRSGVTQDDFFVTDNVEDTTPVLLATARLARGSDLRDERR